MKFSLSQIHERLSASDKPFVEFFRKGDFSMEVYQPVGVDLQTPHAQDEVYIIISGTGTFINGDQTVAFQPQDVLFVPAGVEHRFIDFTDDFKTWVIFF